ncbi:hypothetical protein LF887_01420 [Chryseobacterium sp. MEBOG06]|uniref:hypothetical protein n=1 Tax=Chryseobacterium sp. MEBOG06 TaxID=2879938 RepID=UPI001F451A6B|nr:hypothetical protein [Chryseobacterium sp. MEBOG06]UKB84342.1 hypothetical protein LF887_01420 [Chryseobacterium sp. MEBOG06]
MKIIFILLIIALGICSCTNKNECKAITLEKKYIGNQEDLIIDLNYSTDKKAINLSILNVGKDSIVFTLPKLNFVLIENNNKINKDDDVIKPYTPYVHISKSISYIKKGSNIKNISTDFTMQRNEESIPIKIGFKEKFIKELYIDCKKSDIGDYMIYFLAKNNSNNDKLIQIQYPREVILKIKK